MLKRLSIEPAVTAPAALEALPSFQSIKNFLGFSKKKPELEKKIPKQSAFLKMMRDANAKKMPIKQHFKELIFQTLLNKDFVAKLPVQPERFECSIAYAGNASIISLVEIAAECKKTADSANKVLTMLKDNLELRKLLGKGLLDIDSEEAADAFYHANASRLIENIADYCVKRKLPTLNNAIGLKAENMFPYSEEGFVGHPDLDPSRYIDGPTQSTAKQYAAAAIALLEMNFTADDKAMENFLVGYDEMPSVVVDSQFGDKLVDLITSSDGPNASHNDPQFYVERVTSIALESLLDALEKYSKQQ